MCILVGDSKFFSILKAACGFLLLRYTFRQSAVDVAFCLVLELAAGNSFPEGNYDRLSAASQLSSNSQIVI